MVKQGKDGKESVVPCSVDPTCVAGHTRPVGG